MVRTLIGATGLAILWLLMSGLWDKPLILAFGVASIALSVWIGKRIDAADGEKLRYTLMPFATFRYILWLLAEIGKSNIAVSKLILSGKDPERQKLFMTPVTCKSELAQVMFANSITLTPGTITVETEDEQFIVHALDFSESDMDGLADMDARVAALESARGGF
ncbi:MAG: Na+/H+ antiporter subunit E [Pseudomonadota bacterium]